MSKIKQNFFKRWEVILIGAVFFFVLLLLYLTFFTSNYFPYNSPVQFDIKRGESFSSVSERLAELNIIPSKTNFKIAAFIYGAEKRIRAARFQIPNGLSYLELLDLFISGECYFERKVKIRDGQTLKWTAWKLENTVFTDSLEFINTAYDTQFLNSIGLNQKSIEGYIFTKEYYFYERSSSEEILKKCFDAFNDFYVDSLKKITKQIGFTMHEALTLASIIKGETDRDEEMPIISGVYHNRLRIGIKLQADPTIQYLLPGGWRRLLYDDLKINSPYNTYLYAGLPPGPINNPGETAILAALYPENNRYLYFVADGKGGHKFAKTLNEHNRNVKEYRKLVRSKKSK